MPSEADCRALEGQQLEADRAASSAQGEGRSPGTVLRVPFEGTDGVVGCFQVQAVSNFQSLISSWKYAPVPTFGEEIALSALVACVLQNMLDGSCVSFQLNSVMQE